MAVKETFANTGIAIEVPVMTQLIFAEKTGITPDTVRGLINLGKLPTKKIGRRRFINIAALTSECLSEAGIPLINDQE